MFCTKLDSCCKLTSKKGPYTLCQKHSLCISSCGMLVLGILHKCSTVATGAENFCKICSCIPAWDILYQITEVESSTASSMFHSQTQTPWAEQKAKTCSWPHY